MQELFDALRHVLVLLWAWAFVPCIFSSLAVGERVGFSTSVASEIEFRAFRLQQYEAAGKLYGGKSWRVLYEAVALNRSALRKCVIVSWRDLVERELETSIGAAVGAVLIIIPEDFNALLENEKEAFLKVEEKFANFRTEQAVYFVPSSATLKYLLKSVSLTSTKSPSAFQQLYNAVAANNFQITSENTASTNAITTKQYNVIGQLNAAEHGKPYLVIVAHYDTHFVAPALGKGVDSNGSGMAALFELLAILSQFYSSSPSNRPKYNVVFLLSAGGKFNYQGSRQWVDDFQEKHSDAKIVFTLCLDGLARGNALNFHVSKALTEGSLSHKLFENLKIFAGTKRQVNVVPKKINMAAERLAWEHEIYNVRRIHAATLSHFDNPSDPMRNSILDTESIVDAKAFEENVAMIANAVVSFIFNLDAGLCASSQTGTTASNGAVDCSVVSNSINAKRLLAWLDAFGSTPRSIAALSAPASAKLVADLRAVMQRYADKTSVGEVAMIDFNIFGIVEDKLSASIVKPAIFELFLAAAIGAYLFVAYFLAQNAQFIMERSVVTLKKIA